MAEPLRLLVVDGEPGPARVVEEFLRAGGAWHDAAVRTANTYDEALRAFKEQRFDVAFFDDALGARDGLSLLREVRHRGTRRRSSSSRATAPRMPRSRR